jgi:hypothetical protein
MFKIARVPGISKRSFLDRQRVDKVPGADTLEALNGSSLACHHQATDLLP